jgi:single-stranded-DNA-specific exonuclease
MSQPPSFRAKRWQYPTDEQSAAVTDLSQSLRLPQLIAQLLVNRGHSTPAAATAFLHPKFNQLHEPAALPNMARATERIVRAVRANEAIVIFGDYDVDGITGTAMLWHTLRAAGANVRHYIPHRVSEGYGLNCEAIAAIIDGGATLIVSIDCGGSAIDPCKLARDRGIDLIVTDHHELPAELPPAYAIVHPRLPATACDPPIPPYPNTDLCGAGVAFKLAWSVASALCGGGRVSETYRNLLLEFTALAALGTIADVVPLVGENRIIARFGLAQLPRSKMPGIAALIDAAGYGEKAIDGTAVGFGLAPRLNAAGRMGHADLAVELLTTATPERAAEIAIYLESQNRERQATERRMVQIAKSQIADWPDLPRIIVVASPDFHAGVVGIVASRIVDQFHRPTFVLSTTDDHAHGSARSINGFDLHHAIDGCREHLLSGGGHAMAGGVKLTAANLDCFRAALQTYAAVHLADDLLTPQLPIDATVRLADCTVPTLEYLAQFEPFGRGNPRAALHIAGARISGPPRAVGATGDHLQLQISQGGVMARAIAFKMGPLAAALPVGTEIDLIVEAKIDEWNNHRRVDLQVLDLMRTDGRPLTAPTPQTTAAAS